MAFASKGAGGSVGSATANQASTTLTTATTNVSAGDLAVLVVAVDNNATTTGDEGAVTSVTDTAGNTWQKAIEFCNPSASPAAQAGATCSIWYTNATVALNTGGTITVNFSVAASRDASCLAMWAYTKAAGKVARVDATNTLANNAADPGSLNATTANAARLRVRGTAAENNSTIDWTVTSTWTTWALTVRASATAATSQNVRVEHLISTATGAASDPTFAAVDCASAYVAFEEVDDPKAFGGRDPITTDVTRRRVAIGY